MPSGLALAYMSGRASRGHADRTPSPTVLARALIALAPNPLKRSLRSIVQSAMRRPRLTLCVGKREITLAIGSRSASRVIEALMCDAKTGGVPGANFGSRSGCGMSSGMSFGMTSGDSAALGGIFSRAFCSVFGGVKHANAAGPCIEGAQNRAADRAADGASDGASALDGSKADASKNVTAENRKARRRMLVAVNLRFAPRTAMATIVADTGASAAMTVVARLREHGLLSAGSIRRITLHLSVAYPADNTTSAMEACDTGLSAAYPADSALTFERRLRLLLSAAYPADNGRSRKDQLPRALSAAYPADNRKARSVNLSILLSAAYPADNCSRRLTISLRLLSAAYPADNAICRTIPSPTTLSAAYPADNSSLRSNNPAISETWV